MRKPPPSALQLQVRNYIASRGEAAAATLLSAVRPLFVIDNRGRAALEASGVLFRVAEYRFLMTAAHVLGALKHGDLYIAGTKEIVALEGPCFSSEPKAGTQRDMLDVAILELARDYDDVLAGCRFLAPDDCSVDEVPNWDIPPRTPYLILGYPANMLSVKPSQLSVLPRAFPFTGTAARPYKYMRLRLDVASHVAVDFHYKKVISRKGRQVAPEPYGISGGGIFRFDSLHGPEASPNKLVALTIGGRADTGAIWGTRIECIFAMLRHAYPATRRALPLSQRLRVNVIPRLRTP